VIGNPQRFHFFVRASTEAEREIRMPDLKGFAEVRISKSGLNGRPTADILVDSDIGTEQLGKLIAKVTRDKDLRRLVGLKACLSCRSGFNINIYDQYINVLRIDLREVAGG